MTEDLEADDDVRPQRRSSALPWILFVLALCTAGYLGYVLFEQQARATHDAVAAAHRLTQARDRAARAEERANAAELRVRDLEAERDRLTAARDQLATDVAGLRTQVEASAQQRQALEDRLRTAVAADVGDVATSNEGGSERITLQLVDRVLFRLGEADLTPPGIAVLDRVAEALRAFPDQQIWVEGNTDTTPIHDTTRFASNWELSTARAASVVHYLQDHANIDPRRLAIVGFSEYRPISRRQPARNRRIEIVLFPEDVRVTHD